MTNSSNAVAVAVFAACIPAHAQQAVDMSDCFPKMLQQQRSFNSLTQLELHYLAVMNEETWKTTSQNGDLSILGIGAANYGSFDEQRKKLFTERRLDLNYFRQLDISSTTLDVPAYDVMKTCIYAKAASAKRGLTYVAVAVDENDLTLQFFWNPPTDPYVLKAAGFIVNGNNVDPRLSAGTLAGDGFRITPNTPPILITRTDPKKRVRIVLQTDPVAGYEPIDIEPVAPKPKYAQVMVRKTFEDAVEPEKYKIGEVAFDSFYDFKANVDGDVIATTCSYSANYYHMNSCSPNGTQIHCLSHKGRSDTRSALTISATYLSPQLRCTENCGSTPQPYPAEDSASNYSFDSKSALSDLQRACSWQAAKVK